MKISTNEKKQPRAKRKPKTRPNQLPPLDPLTYEAAFQLVREAEARYRREYEDPRRAHFAEAILDLEQARYWRAAAALVEVQSRSYDVRRTSFADGSATVMRAPDALTQIREEWLPDHDVVVDDDALRDGLPVYTFSASYQAIL